MGQVKEAGTCPSEEVAKGRPGAGPFPGWRQPRTTGHGILEDDGRERSRSPGGQRCEHPRESEPRRSLAARAAVTVSALPLPPAAPGTEEGTFWNLLLQATWSERQATVLPGAGGESQDAARWRLGDPHPTTLLGRTSGPQSSAATSRVTGQQAQHGLACGPHSPGRVGESRLPRRCKKHMPVWQREGRGSGWSEWGRACVRVCPSVSM